MADLNTINQRISKERKSWHKWAVFWTVAFGAMVMAAAALSGLSAIFALMEVKKELTAATAFSSGIVASAFAASRPADKRHANRLARSEADVLLNYLMMSNPDPDKALKWLNQIIRDHNEAVSVKMFSIDEVKNEMDRFLPTPEKKTEAPIAPPEKNLPASVTFT